MMKGKTICPPPLRGRGIKNIYLDTGTVFLSSIAMIVQSHYKNHKMLQNKIT